MRRPLFALCVTIVCLIACIERFGTLNVSGKRHMEELMESGSFVVLRGEVSERDAESFILKSIYLTPAGGQNISISGKLKIKYDNINDGKVPLIGSTVGMSGTFVPYSRASNPGEFDTHEYYKSLNIGGSLYDVKILANDNDCSVFREYLYMMRAGWEKRLYEIFPEKEASVMSAVLLGDKGDIDEYTKELYQRNGIIHILSISGLHITLLGMGIYKLLKRLYVPRLPAALCGGLALIAYGLMVGFPVSVTRAVGMYVLRMSAQIVLRTYDMLTSLGILAVYVLLCNPHCIAYTGFQLSFASILGVGSVYASFEFENEDERGTLRYEKHPIFAKVKMFTKEKAGNIAQGMLASLSITLTTLPIMLCSYYEVPVYSVFLNILVLPLMGVLLATGFAAMLIPGAGVIGTADVVILYFYEKLCELFDGIPHSTWNPGYPKIWQTVLYYTILLGFIYVYRLRIRKSKNIPYRVKKLMALIMLSFVCVFLYHEAPSDETVFLYVGQGNGVCMETEAGAHFIFDFGSTSRDSVGKYVLKPYLKYSGISHIDAVFVSHPDEDHISGIEELLENRETWNIDVDAVVIAAAQKDEFAAWEEKYGVNVVYIKQYDVFTSGAVRFICLHPAEEFHADDANSASECFLVEYADGESMLLTGDVQGEGEAALMRELSKRGVSDISLLQCAHHGSKNSTPVELLDILRPKATVISCGKNNRYRHPHAETMERLNAAGTEVFRTDISGAVTVRMEDGVMSVEEFIKK